MTTWRPHRWDVYWTWRRFWLGFARDNIYTSVHLGPVEITRTSIKPYWPTLSKHGMIGPRKAPWLIWSFDMTTWVVGVEIHSRWFEAQVGPLSGLVHFRKR